jgi:hypothetical protein
LSVCTCLQEPDVARTQADDKSDPDFNVAKDEMAAADAAAAEDPAAGEAECSSMSCVLGARRCILRLCCCATVAENFLASQWDPSFAFLLEAGLHLSQSAVVLCSFAVGQLPPSWLMCLRFSAALAEPAAAAAAV